MRRRRILVFAALTLGSAIIAGGLAALATGGHRTSSRHATTQTASSTTTSAPTGGWRPVAPATTVPEGTPVQQQYDRGFEEGFSSPGNEAMLHQGRCLGAPRPRHRRWLAGSRRERDARWLGDRVHLRPLRHRLRPPELWRARGVVGGGGGA